MECGGVEDKVVGVSTSILVTFLRIGTFVMPTWVVDARLLYINSWGCNSRCYLFCNMALIFTIESIKDSTFALLATKASTFVSMVAFHFASNGSFTYIFSYFVTSCCPMICWSPQPTTHPCKCIPLYPIDIHWKLHPSISFHSILPLPFHFIYIH